jgi:hypothetical protein
MASQRRGKQQRTRDGGAFGRLLFQLAEQLFGGKVDRNAGRWHEPVKPATPAPAVPVLAPEPGPAAEPPPAPEPAPIMSHEPSNPEPAPMNPNAEAARVLEEALAHVESMPRDLAELRRSLAAIFERIEEVLDRVASESRRLAEESTRLANLASRLEERLETLGGPFPQEAPSNGQPAAEEPRFAAGGKPVGVVLAAVPGFQGLMDAQRGLNDLRGAERASVTSLRDGEASLQLTLRAPVTPREIVDGLTASTGYMFVIEEVRPEEARLRLRFVENGAG